MGTRPRRANDWLGRVVLAAILLSAGVAAISVWVGANPPRGSEVPVEPALPPADAGGPLETDLSYTPTAPVSPLLEPVALEPSAPQVPELVPEDEPGHASLAEALEDLRESVCGSDQRCRREPPRRIVFAQAKAAVLGLWVPYEYATYLMIEERCRWFLVDRPLHDPSGAATERERFSVTSIRLHEVDGRPARVVSARLTASDPPHLPREERQPPRTDHFLRRSWHGAARRGGRMGARRARAPSRVGPRGGRSASTSTSAPFACSSQARRSVGSPRWRMASRRIGSSTPTPERPSSERSCTCRESYMGFDSRHCPTIELDQSCPGVCVPERIVREESR